MKRRLAKRARGWGVARAAVTVGIACAAFGCAGGLFGSAAPRDAVRFAVWTSIAEPGSAVPFLGYWVPSKFVDLSAGADALARSGALFARGAAFEGTSEDGALVRLAFERLEPGRARGEVAESLSFRVERDAGDPALRAILVHSAGVRVESLEPQPVTLDRDADTLLRRRAEALFRRALRSRASSERFDAIELGAPEALAVPQAPEIVSVSYPVTLVQHLGRGDALRDERATVFFLFDAARREPILASFGHPEWSPKATADEVQTVQPLGWLRMAGDERVYLFATRQLGWEHVGWAIFELRTGRLALRTP